MKVRRKWFCVIRRSRIINFNHQLSFFSGFIQERVSAIFINEVEVLNTHRIAAGRLWKRKYRKCIRQKGCKSQKYKGYADGNDLECFWSVAFEPLICFYQSSDCQQNDKNVRESHMITEAIEYTVAEEYK